MSPGKAKKIFETFKKNNPHPKIELKHQTPFELLVAVVLSAHTTDVSVNKVTAKLFPKVNSPQKLLKLGEARFKKAIKSIGLYNAKAKNIIKTCKILVEKHKGKVPNTREALESLPGVGRKSASVILNTVFGQPTIGVDTHAFRVSNRTGLAPGKNVKIVEGKLLRIVPDKFKHEAHHWLVLHGRYICKAKKPNCKHCVIEKFCEFKEKEL